MTDTRKIETLSVSLESFYFLEVIEGKENLIYILGNYKEYSVRCYI